MLKSITFYDPTTGYFTGSFTGPEEEIEQYRMLPYIEGLFDKNSQFFNLMEHKVQDLVAAQPVVPLLHELRNKRNELLNDFRWTVMPDSPLTEACKAEWLLYLKALQSVLKDVVDTTTVVWPVQPSYEYEQD